MLPKKKCRGEEAEVDVKDGAEDTHGSNKSIDFDSLPIEILEVLFGYFTHTEKLISRLVCTKWNTAICSSLSKRAFFIVNCKENHQVLLDSYINWTKIIMFSYDFSMGRQFKQFISTLHLTLPKIEFDLTECMEFLVGFPNVKNLALKIYKTSKPTNEKFLTPKGFENFVRGLEFLEIICPFKEYNALIQLLVKLSEYDLGLIRLDIKEIFPDIGGLITDELGSYKGPIPFPALYQIISKTYKTLRQLKLVFYPEDIMSTFFPDFISKFCDTGDKEIMLNLETLALYCKPLQQNIVRDFQILEKLVSTQANLKECALMSSRGQSLSQNMVLSLPSSVRILRSVFREHIGPEFPKHMESIDSLQIIASTPMDGLKMFHQSCPSVRKLQVHRSLDDSLEDELTACPLLKNLAECFPNVVELGIILPRRMIPTIFDSDLQIIIEHFQGLRCLQLSHGKGITDFGVSGVSEKYCQELFNTGTLYICPGFNIPRRNVIGKPISNLKKLEKLDFGCGSTITDAGIFFGFRFGSTLKSLKIKLTSNEQVSNWGLHWLGKNCPGLEQFEGKFRSKRISAVGESIIEKQLPLLEFTQKFKWDLI